MSSLYRKIGSPVLTDIAINVELDAVSPAGTASPINRTYPRQLTDLSQGEQLVWVGRYRHAGSAKVTLAGVAADERKSFSFPTTFVAKSHDETFGFVEKLWATRRVGEIIDELDLRGQNQELVDELVKLSIQHGIMTPYTSFLADENVSLADTSNMTRARDVSRRELSKADGVDGFAQRAFKGKLQSSNQAAGAGGASSGPADKKMAGPTLGGFSAPSSSRARNKPNRISGLVTEDSLADKSESADSNLRQVGQKTFFRKNKLWQDSTVTDEQSKNAIRVKQFSREYFDLAAKHSGTLAKYIAFDEPVLVNLDDKTYQIDPEEPEKS